MKKCFKYLEFSFLKEILPLVHAVLSDANSEMEEMKLELDLINIPAEILKTSEGHFENAYIERQMADIKSCVYRISIINAERL